MVKLAAIYRFIEYGFQSATVDFGLVMNTEDRESENLPAIAKQTPASKHAFEWPDDQQNSAQPVIPNANWIQREHLANWVSFWFMGWFGTTVAGALFGGALGLFGVMESPVVPLLGLLYGGLWAGAVGLFVFVHLGVICWTFWWLRRPLITAVIAGLLTGAICGLVFFSLVTAPMGAVGAYIISNKFLKSTKGKNFLATTKSAQDQSLGPLKFTMMDLLLRVTVLAVFIAGWSAWLQSY